MDWNYLCGNDSDNDNDEKRELGRVRRRCNHHALCMRGEDLIFLLVLVGALGVDSGRHPHPLLGS